MYNKEWAKEYYKKNKDRIKINIKKYQENNRDKIIIGRKKYKNSIKYKIYTKKYRKTEKYKKLAREISKRYYKNNKFKHSVRGLVKTAIINKKLYRPKKCSECGLKTKIEAHHNDYSKPYNIIWLCKKCHYEEHKKYN